MDRSAQNARDTAKLLTRLAKQGNISTAEYLQTLTWLESFLPRDEGWRFTELLGEE